MRNTFFIRPPPQRAVCFDIIIANLSGRRKKRSSRPVARCPAFLLTEDKKYGDSQPFRTYYGFKYEGGYSDQLPLIVDFLLLK